METYTTDITKLLYGEPVHTATILHDMRKWCDENFGLGQYDIRWSVSTGSAMPSRMLVVYRPEHMLLFKLRWE